MSTWKTHDTNTMKKGVGLLAFSFLFLGKTFAQVDSLTVEEAVAFALRNNYDIALARQDSALAALNYLYRNYAFYPQLNGSGTYLRTHSNQRQTLADGSKRIRDGIASTNLNASVNLNWTIFDGFRMFLLRDRLDIALEQGTLVARTAVINTVANVMTTYYDIVRQQQQLRNIEEQIQLSSDRLKLAQYRFDVGAGIKPDVLQAQIDYNNSKAAQFSQIGLIEQRRQTLNQLMNANVSVNYKVSDTIPVRTDLALNNLLNNLSAPEIQLSRANIRAAQLDVRLAKALRYPTVALTSAYNFTRTSNNQVINQFSALFNLNRGFNYGVTVSVPIFNGFNVRQQIQQAQLAVRYQQLILENQTSFLNTSLTNAYRNYAAQLQAVEVLQSSVAVARENLFIERERYRLGRTTFIELRTAEENVSTVITNLINTRYNLKAAEIELMRLRGDIVR